MMLRKPSDSRPSLQRILAQLTAIIAEPILPETKSGIASVARVAARIQDKLSAEEAAKQTQAAFMARRVETFREAKRTLDQILERLLRALSSHAPLVEQKQKGFTLGKGRLIWDDYGIVPENYFPNEPPPDLLCGAWIGIRQLQPDYRRSSSLWYTDLGQGGSNRWYEVTYMDHPLARSSNAISSPFSLEPHVARKAHAPGMGAHQIAWGPEPIDDENEEQFINRWAELLARAAEGRLSHPRYLPMKDPLGF